MTDHQPITETWAPFYQKLPDESYAAFVLRIRAHPPGGPLLEETPPRTLAPTHTCGASDWYINPAGARVCRPCRTATKRRRRQARRTLP